jgi:hypothetical protein
MALGRELSVLINPADVATVADGVLVNAVWAVGQIMTRPRESRRVAAGLDTVGWMDTERLTREGLPGATLELPELAEAEAAKLEAALKRDEVQGALQVLLAARLTDAPETDAARAREAVRLALSGTQYAQQLSEYLDDKISALVAMLEGRVGYAGLAQVRAEAYNSRIVALLGTITNMLAALSPILSGAVPRRRSSSGVTGGRCESGTGNWNRLTSNAAAVFLWQISTCLQSSMKFSTPSEMMLRPCLSRLR